MSWDCKAIIDFLDRYVAGELDPEVAKVFERHCVDCPPCLDYLESYKQTIKLCKRAHSNSENPDCSEVPNELVEIICRSKPS